MTTDHADRGPTIESLDAKLDRVLALLDVIVRHLAAETERETSSTPQPTE